MGKIIISQNVSLDGVVQDPRGEEGLGRGDWFERIDADALDEWREALAAEAETAGALLVGRRTFEYFASRYPSRSGRLADRLNAMPKYVVSATLGDVDAWSNARLLRGDLVENISQVKARTDGSVVVYASRGLVTTLIQHDLADGLRLMVYPLVVGAGEQLFAATERMKHLRYVGTRTAGEAIVFLDYEFVHDARTLG